MKISIVVVAAGVITGGLLISAAVTTYLVRDTEVPPDTVLLVDGRAHSRAAFDEFRSSHQPFVSAPAAQRAILSFAEQLVVRREAERMGIGDATHHQVLAHVVAAEGEQPKIESSDVESFYARNQERFIRPRKVRAAYFRMTRTVDAERDAQQIAAVHIRAQMAQSEQSLAALWAEHADGVSAGELAPFSCSDGLHPVLPEEVVRKACSLPVGGLSAPVATELAYFLVRKKADYPALHLPLARVEREIRNELTSSARNAALDAARQRLLDAADIEIPDGAVAPLVRVPAGNSQPTQDVQPSGPPRAPGWG